MPLHVIYIVAEMAEWERRVKPSNEPTIREYVATLEQRVRVAEANERNLQVSLVLCV